MFSLKERKKHTQNIINYIEKKISILPINRYIIGYFIVLFHWIITLIPLIYIFIGLIPIFFTILNKITKNNNTLNIFNVFDILNGEKNAFIDNDTEHDAFNI